MLGKNIAPVADYSPELLYPIPRSPGRQAQGIRDVPYGADLWHAYEMSWLERGGKPIVRVGRFTVPANTPNMVESKSFKLYLNSLNNERFDSEQAALSTIIQDVGAVVGGDVKLELMDVEDARLAGAVLDGACLDGLEMTVGDADKPDIALLIPAKGERQLEEKLYSHLLRSLCPVTGQPDWATVWLHYRGTALDRSALLRYLLAFRNHHEYHEQCAERMFHDISRACKPEFLHIQAFYTRRGGMDINPFRSSVPGAEPLPRLNRQ